MFSLFNSAFSMAGAPAGAGSGSGMGFETFIPLILMIAIFYFLLIRPQQKKEKERVKMISSIQPGDKILTASGIYGTVSALKDENTILLKIAKGVEVEITRSSIQNKIS